MPNRMRRKTSRSKLKEPVLESQALPCSETSSGFSGRGHDLRGDSPAVGEYAKQLVDEQVAAGADLLLLEYALHQAGEYARFLRLGRRRATRPAWEHEGGFDDGEDEDD